MLKDEVFAMLVNHWVTKTKRPGYGMLQGGASWHIGVFRPNAALPSFLCALNEEYNPKGVNGIQECCVVCRRLLDEALARGLEQIAELERSVR